MKTFILTLLLACAYMAGVRAAYAAETAPLDKVSEKVDELLKGQKEILQQLSEIKQELYVVKIRASRR